MYNFDIIMHRCDMCALQYMINRYFKNDANMIVQVNQSCNFVIVNLRCDIIYNIFFSFLNATSSMTCMCKAIIHNCISTTCE